MYCEICGKREATDTHHLICGYGLRQLCDQDKLTIEICRTCHTELHKTSTSEHLSKMLGQMMFESRKSIEGYSMDQARELFRKRYSKSFL